MSWNKKLGFMFIGVLVCLVLLVASSYAWLTLSLRPEVHSVDTNIGANGSLEIALLTEQTHADPILIRTTIGDSAVAQNTMESNQSWGNVIELNDERYGLRKITLLPARLNVLKTGDEYTVDNNLLRTAEYGVDGRMTMLSDDLVSTVMGENAFTYYADRQLYGVRAIGTISNLTSQQTALAAARSTVKAYTAAAARTVKYAWRDQGAGIMDIMQRRYALEENRFAVEDVAVIRKTAEEMLAALGYIDGALRQGIVGMAASVMKDDGLFDTLCANITDTSVPLSIMVKALGSVVPDKFVDWANTLDAMKMDLQRVIANSFALKDGANWNQIEPLLDVLLDAEKTYLGENKLSNPSAYEKIGEDTALTLTTDSGCFAKIADFTGNYSAFSQWKENASAELCTISTIQTPHLSQIEMLLENATAASGNWTRANMDDIYGFAMDLAFRCNEASNLQLQTAATLRVDENAEMPVTQGSGSYMRFSSENMDTLQLLQLMDSIRIGFLSDRNTLLAVAKLNVTNYEEQEEGVLAPLYLYEYTVDDNGVITIGERCDENAAIASLPKNSPTVITVVVWLDGDAVDNSFVSTTANQSMDGVLNLQFSSSAYLRPANISIKDKK